MDLPNLDVINFKQRTNGLGVSGTSLVPDQEVVVKKRVAKLDLKLISPSSKGSQFFTTRNKMYIKQME